MKQEAYASLVALAAAGELKVEFEAIELERVAEAWERLAAGRGILNVAKELGAGTSTVQRIKRAMTQASTHAA